MNFSARVFPFTFIVLNLQSLQVYCVHDERWNCMVVQLIRFICFVKIRWVCGQILLMAITRRTRIKQYNLYSFYRSSVDRRGINWIIIASTLNAGHRSSSLRRNEAYRSLVKHIRFQLDGIACIAAGYLLHLFVANASLCSCNSTCSDNDISFLMSRILRYYNSFTIYRV